VSLSSRFFLGCFFLFLTEKTMQRNIKSQVGAVVAIVTVALAVCCALIASSDMRRADSSALLQVGRKGHRTTGLLCLKP